MIKGLFVFVLSVLLIISLIFGTLIFSVFGVLGYDLQETVSESVEHEIEDNVNESQLDIISEGLREACRGRDSIEFDVDGEIVSFNCSEVESKDIEEVLSEQISDETDELLDDNLGIGLNEATERVWNVLAILGVIALILVAFIVFIERWDSLKVLGIVFMISGLPFLLSWVVDNIAISSLGGILPEGVGLSDIPKIGNVLDSLVWAVFRNYLIVFVLGVVLLGFGIGIKMGLGRKK